MLTLYDKSECPFCWKVRLAMHHLGIAFEEVTIDTDNKPAAFLAISPSGKVPLLDDNGLHISESTLIALYLDDLEPNASLFAGNAVNRHKSRSLNHYADTQIGPAIRDAIFEQRNKTENEWDQAVIAQCRDNWLECQAYLDQQLANESAFCGEFGLADCALLPRFALAAAYGMPIGNDYPRLKKWYAVHSSSEYFKQSAPERCLQQQQN
jgi:glutathione S-transferase